jgi:hypothetical protein
MSQSIIERLDTALVEDSADGGLFELEIKHLLERNWVYLAHESSEQERLFHGVGLTHLIQNAGATGRPNKQRSAASRHLLARITIR